MFKIYLAVALEEIIYKSILTSIKTSIKPLLIIALIAALTIKEGTRTLLRKLTVLLEAQTAFSKA